MNLQDWSAVKHDWKFAGAGSLRFDNESKLAFETCGW
jgi:hypothetical protein